MHRLLVEFSDVNSKPEADEWKLAGAGFKQVWRSPAYITREKSAIFIGRYIDNGMLFDILIKKLRDLKYETYKWIICSQ